MGRWKDRSELFLREYFACGWDATEAYRRIYGPCKTASVQAAKLMARPYVKKRYQAMVKRLVKRADITEEKILTQYQDAYDMAEKTGKTADMISASTAQAKLVGILRERMEAGAPGDFERMDNISDVLESLAAQVGPDIAAKIGEALGVMPQPAIEDDRLLAEAEPVSDAIN